MSFIRPENRNARLRRAGMATLSDASLTENEIAQINAINNTSSYCRTLLFSYLALGTTLFILVSGTTHEDLLRETPVKMPLFDIGVPLLTFYVVAPLLFVLFHVNLLNKLSQLRKQIEKLGSAEREIVRGRLFPFDYALLFGGFEQDRQEKAVLWIIVGSTLFVMPTLLLLYTQYQFLAYHSGPITSWHSVLVTFDLGTLVFFHLQRDEFPNFQSTASTFGALVSWLVLVTPDSALDQHGTNEFWDKEASVIGLYRNLQLEGRTFWAADPPPEIIAAYIEQYGPDDVRVEEARAGYGQPMDLRDRDLRYANFVRSRLTHANLVKTQLQGAELEEINLQGADLSDAHLEDADLEGAQLQHAKLLRTQLQWSFLWGAQFQGADLTEANLYGASAWLGEFQGTKLLRAELGYADFEEAQMQGSDLSLASLNETTLNGADLQGANLRHASLMGADLMGINLRGAYLANGNLQGSSLFGARLQGAVFSGANLQGTNLTDSWLQGADFESANLQGATFARARIQGVNLTEAELAYVDFSGANAIEPAQSDWSKFWLEVSTLDEHQSNGWTQTEMHHRLDVASKRGPEPIFGDVMEMRTRMENSLPGDDIVFVDWPQVDGDQYHEQLLGFLLDLGCEHEAIGTGIAMHRVSHSPEGATFARQMLEHVCPEMTTPGVFMTKHASRRLDWIIASVEEGSAAGAD